MDDYDKYLKYKKKYFNLKTKQRGGYNGTIFSLEDEIHFWGKQMMEHALFLYLGLEDKDLKPKAFKLHTKWKEFMHKNFYDKGIRVSHETIFLSLNDLSKAGNIDTDKAKKLIDQTEEFKKKVIDILGQGKWIGWIFPALAEHMLTEALYFRRKINGPTLSLDEEIKFINDHHGTEMGATAQLIDPNPAQQKIIDIARSYALKTMAELKAGTSLSGMNAAGEQFPRQWTIEDENILKGLESTDQATLLRLSIQYSKELTDFANDTGKKIESNQLKSIISPILAHHVHREFARFTETLKILSP